MSTWQAPLILPGVRTGMRMTEMRFPHYDLVPKDLDANIRFRMELLRDAANDFRACQQLKVMCSEDILFYVNTFCFTSDPRLMSQKLPSRIPFVTYGFQDEALRDLGNCILNGSDATISKSRDMGASWICITAFEWFWHFFDDLSFLMISRNEKYVDQSGNPKTLFWKIDYLHQNQPNWLLPSGRWLGGRDPCRKLMHIENADNGSVIDGESTTGDAGRGDRRTGMLVDEHGAFDVNDSFKVLSASRDTSDCRIFNSTPQGAHNGFFEVVHNTSAHNIRLHWSVHPVKAEGLYRTGVDGRVELLDSFRGMVVFTKKGHEKKSVMFPDDYPFRLDGKLRSPWYDSQCNRCVSEKEIAQELDIDFVGSDFLFFDSEYIDVLRKKCAREPDLVGDLEYYAETCEPKRFVENPKGKLKLWIPLTGDGRIAADRKFVTGSDVSAGTGASNSVTSVVDVLTGEKVAVWADANTLPDPFSAQSIAIAKFFNRAFMIWDGSGPTGETFKKQVVRNGYGRIYYRRNEKKVGRPVSDEPGFFINGETRTSLLQDYRQALVDSAFINHSDNGLRECLEFIHKKDGNVEHRKSINALDPSGARSAHGDEAIADALASLGVSEFRESPVSMDEPDVPVGSLAWRRQNAENKNHERLFRINQDALSEGW